MYRDGDCSDGVRRGVHINYTGAINVSIKVNQLIYGSVVSRDRAVADGD